MKVKVISLMLAIVLANIVCARGAESASDSGGKKPNILVIWGDDIGTWNISYWSRGMMGYKTPNIDRLAKEGVSFTDYYGQQSCTAGRAAFLGGNVPVRTGMTKVGLPGAKEGWQKSDVTIATVMKSLGYATGQFGKNHQGDRDEHLPTNHGFDEFMGNLYHLNAEEEPENEDYPGDMKLANGKTFKQQFGPRGVIHSYADGRIEDTGPLTKKRMETVDEETLAAAKDFIERQQKAGKPFFVWYNTTRMHLRTHVKAEHRHKGNDEYTDGMIEHDAMVGDLLKFLDDNGLADNTIVQYSTDNAPHYNTWPDAGTVPFRSEKNSNWEGAYRVPCFVRWPGHFPAGVTLNGLFAHEDWLPTFAAIAGAPDIKEKLKAGVDLNGRHYRNYIDGYDMTAYLTGKTNSSPRNEFWYVNDDGQIVAARWGDWKVVFLENRGEAFGVWREPFIELRVPLLFNLRRDPFEKAQHNANVYNDWFLSRVFVLVPIQQLAGKFLMTMKDYPPSQSPGSFNLEKIQKQLEGGPSSAEETPTPTGSPTGKRGDTQKTQPAEPESRPSDSAANPLGDQEWRLTKLNGEPIEQAKGAGAEPPSLKFDAEKEAVSGSTGVNRLTGTYEVDENKLKFGGLATTKRAGSPELMERETEFVNALESADSWKRTGGNLEILSGDKVVAVFAQPAQ